MRLNLVLVAALVACALSLISSQQQARRLFIDLDRAQSQAKQLEIEWNQLQIEQSTWGKHALIDQVARRDLRMVPVTPARTQYVTQQRGAAAESPQGGEGK
jgi:cell division protein FtsL